MSEQGQGPAPDGREEAASADIGEPERETGRRRGRADQRPDLDERERRIRTERKPMGPPLEGPAERAPEPPPVPPTTPEDG